ncbi:MAG: Tll0287-like domain-containing protein [Rubrivivax sp.]
MNHSTPYPSFARRSATLLALLVASLGVAADESAWLGDARQVAGAVPPKLLATLSQAIDKSGPEGAIAVCRDEAPKLAKAASEQTGWTIRRVSLRERNPKAVPDAWERAALEDFDRRAAAGESPATLEKAEVVVENGQKMQRYMRALPTQALCLSCHGPSASLSPAVTAQLNALYPADKAVGYRVGDIRGAMTIKRAQ